MYSVTKVFEISYAHMLSKHKGKCRNLHGHNAIVMITLGSYSVFEDGPSAGMAVDFGDIKEIAKREVLDLLDHKTLVKGDEWIYDAAKLYASQFPEEERAQFLDQFVVLNFETTAENLSQWCNDKLRECFTAYGVVITDVKWYETRDNVASFME